MDPLKERKKLFNEFPPVSTQEWEDKIIKDLKGADYNKKLVWRTLEGFDVKPYYRSEDLEGLEYLNAYPAEFPFVRGNTRGDNDWHIRQNIKCCDIKAANKKALNILMRGVTSLGFELDPNTKPTAEVIEQLTENIFADAVELNFSCGDYALEVLEIIQQLVKKYNRDLDKIHGSIDYDPLGYFSVKGNFRLPHEEAIKRYVELIEKARHIPNYKVVSVSGHIFHNAGASVVEELAFSLSMGAAYLSFLTDQQLSINDLAPRMKFNFGVGSNYFMEIAKIRAARLLWANIVNAYGPENADITRMYVHSSTSEWNKSLYDPYVNMLRTTTEAMSAVIGGSDSLEVQGFNASYENTTEFSERIARNQQLLLKEESYLDKVVDPSAGSYYIENLTHSIAEEAWKLFLEVEEKGGYLEAFKAGFIQERIKATADKRLSNIAQRREVILGTNQYPNFTEHKEEDFDASMFEVQDQSREDAIVETLKPFRASIQFDKLRYATDQYSKENERPKAFMLTYGNLAMRRARSMFASNFFACAGFETIDNNGFANVEEGMKAAKEAGAHIIVLCSSDDEYAELAPAAKELLDKEILVVAGYPKDLLEEFKSKGIENFIHVRSNVLETLRMYQLQLGIV